MSDFISNFIVVLPSTALFAGRIVMCILAIWIVVRCCRSLFGGKTEQEVWGFLSMANGARYELYHWENVIGRARSSDIRVNFPSVSRSHAAICRNDAGAWTVYPLNTTNGILLNGTRIFAASVLQAGDSISVGGVELYFFPASENDEAKQAQKRTKAGRVVSPAVTLILLSTFQLLTFLQFLPMYQDEYFAAIAVAFGFLMALMWCFFLLCHALKRTACEVETLAFFLSTVGFAVASAYAPESLMKLMITAILGLIIYLIMNMILRNLRLSVKLRWPVAIAAAGLLAFNLVLGERIFGAKNWVAIGPITFQPSEFVKIAFILVGAATLDRLFAKRNLIFTVLFSAYCVGCLALMSDFGTALIFFVAFLCIAFLRSGDLPSIVMMTAAAGFAGGIVLHFKPYIAERFTVWRHAWEFTQSTGYQQSRTMSAIAAGGLCGTGPDKGWLKYVGAANTDLVFGVVSEEFGLIISLCAVAVIIILARVVLESAATARSTFYTIVSCAAATMFVVQVMLNVFGAVDLLPLTGVTFPFVSMGGSSMMACWGLLSFIKSADTRQNASFVLRLPKKIPVSAIPNAVADPQPKVQSGFFSELPDIPVDEIFGKEEES